MKFLADQDVHAVTIVFPSDWGMMCSRCHRGWHHNLSEYRAVPHGASGAKHGAALCRTAARAVVLAALLG
jgi:hypothetical protein